MLVLGDREFARIADFVRENYGINLTKKIALIQGRLALDIERRGYPSFKAYFDEVIAHPGGTECQHLIDKLSTNHTFFFREPDCLEHMCRTAVPELVKKGVTQIDVWCAAAASGQECYTVAMVLAEALLLHRGVSYHILGSDINSEVLKKAAAGIYANAELQHIPPRFHKRYCRPVDDGHFEIVPALKERISWQQINLVKPPRTMKPQHLIFCRNVMIYFEPDVKEALTAELYRLVRDGGFVYIGNTETLDMKRTRFCYLGPSVFAKKEQSREIKQ